MSSSNPMSSDADVASPAFLDNDNIEYDHASASICAAVNRPPQVPYDLTSEIIEDIPGRSSEGSDVDHEGWITSTCPRPDNAAAPQPHNDRTSEQDAASRTEPHHYVAGDYRDTSAAISAAGNCGNEANRWTQTSSRAPRTPADPIGPRPSSDKDPKPPKPIDGASKAKVRAVHGTRSSAFIVLLTGAVWLVGCGENSPSTPAEMSPAVSQPAAGVPGQAAPEAKAKPQQTEDAPPPR